MIKHSRGNSSTFTNVLIATITNTSNNSNLLVASQVILNTLVARCVVCKIINTLNFKFKIFIRPGV
jgi:hypothetical protein